MSSRNRPTTRSGVDTRSFTVDNILSMSIDFKPSLPKKPDVLFVTASLAVLLSIAPQVSHADGDPRVGKLISQSGVALHVDALRSTEVIHAEGSVVASGLSGS